MEFFNKYNQEKPQKGDLLLSEPFLPDPNFERTVILLCEHGDDGSFGFVLNKRSNVTFSDVMEDAKNIEQELFIGGPVQQDTLHFIHTNDYELEGGQEVNGDITWGGNFEQLLFHADTGVLQPSEFIFFLGYSGWSPGQLDDELKQNSWIVYKNVSKDLVFKTSPDDLWKIVLKSMGGKYSLFSQYPVDPNMN
jgi:putative transcriptional regulator